MSGDLSGARLRLLFAGLGAPLRTALAPLCLVCGVELAPLRGGPVCPGCRADYFPQDLRRCPICAIELPALAQSGQHRAPAAGGAPLILMAPLCWVPTRRPGTA